MVADRQEMHVNTPQTSMRRFVRALSRCVIYVARQAEIYTTV